jgi:ribosomal protein S18 acetylase RimI-like enzyme
MESYRCHLVNSAKVNEPFVLLVMHIRLAQPQDVVEIFRLYMQVAQTGEYERRTDEVTTEYVEEFLTASTQRGLCMVIDHPDGLSEIIGELHAYHPDFQGRKLGRTLLTIFLEEIALHHSTVGKIETVVSEANTKALNLLTSLGFQIEGRQEMNIRAIDGRYLADIILGWQNPTFEFE